MKKYIIGILVISVLIEAVVFVLFTQTGNGWLLSYINRSLSENTKGVNIALTSLRIHPTSLSAVAKVNETAEIKLQGPVSWWGKEFNMTYRIDAKQFKSGDIAIKKPLHIKGSAYGDRQTMEINGSGEAFGAPVTYALKVIDESPQNIRLNVKEANLQDILAILGQKPYAKGKLSADIDMPTLDTDNPKGIVKITIKDGVVFAEPIKTDYSISLSGDTEFEAAIHAKAKGQGLSLDADVISSLGRLKLNDAEYDLSQRSLQSGYSLVIEDFVKIDGVLPIALRGGIDIAGELFYAKEKVGVTGTTRSFEGESTFRYKDDKLNAVFKKVRIEKLLGLLNQPKYANGTLDGMLKVDDLQKPVGNFTFQSLGKVNANVVKREFGIDLGKPLSFSGSLEGMLKKNKVNAKSTWKTDIGTLKLTDILYSIPKASLTGNYKLDIPDLGKLASITGKKFRGDMAFDGKIVNKDALMTITGEGKEFGGAVDFVLKGEQLNAHAKGVTVSKLMYMFVYPQVIEAMSEATLAYNLSTKTGNLDATLDSVRILPNKLTRLINEFLHFNLAQERYNNSKFLAKITPKRIDFSLNAANKNSYIKVPKGVLFKESEKIAMEVDVSINGKDIQATVGGTLDSPNIKLDTSNFLKQKLNKKLDNLLGKDQKDGSQSVKGVLKGLF